MILLDIDDVASFFFLSTTSTTPNASLLLAILYARALLSAACGKRLLQLLRFPWISRFRRPSVTLPYKLESDDVASFFFLSTISTVPNPSILFATLYDKASLSAEVVDFSGYPSLIAFCQSYKLESDDVASFFFLSTTSTVPNLSILFAILYARASLSAEVVDFSGYPSLIAFCQSYKLESDDVASFFFLSTTSTVPNPSILFAILYARHFF